MELTTRIHTMSWGHASQASVFRTVSLFFCMPESICIMALLPGLFTVAPILQNSGCTRPVFLTSALVFGRYVPLEQLGIDAIITCCCLQSGGFKTNRHESLSERPCHPEEAFRGRAATMRVSDGWGLWIGRSPGRSRASGLVSTYAAVHVRHRAPALGGPWPWLAATSLLV